MTASSVMMRFTTHRPVSGREQRGRILCAPRAVCSMVTTTRFALPTRSTAQAAGREIASQSASLHPKRSN